MSLWSRLRSRVGALVRRSKFEEDMSTELNAHIQLYADDLMSRGMPKHEALRKARVEFGTVEAIKDDCREAKGVRVFDEVRRDLKFGLRMLTKSPGFTLTVLVILASVIGANTAIFSVVDAVLLRSLPYPQPERLGQLVIQYTRGGPSFTLETLDGTTWEIVRDNTPFLDVAAYSASPLGVNFASKGSVSYVRQQRVSSGFFRVLGFEPLLGREFTPAEDRPGGSAPVAILSHGLWERALDGDDAIVGKTILLLGEAHTVVGVMPKDFETHVPADVWTPLRPSTTGEGSGTNYTILARLSERVSWPEAELRLGTVGPGAIAHLRLAPEMTATLELEPLQERMTASLRGTLILSLLAVLVVLVIGCANVAGLMLARAATRTREVATRMLMGGGRATIVRQLLTESLLLATLGGILGIGVGYALVTFARPYVTSSLALWQGIELDARVLALTMLTAVTTSVLFGLYPALSASRLDFRSVLSDGGQRSVTGSRSRWSRRALLIGQTALGVVLLVGAGLLVRSVAHLNGLDAGFDPTRVTTATLSLQDARYQTSGDVERLFDDTLERIRELPGVDSAAVGLSAPFERWLNMPFRRADGTNESGLTTLMYATPGYFETLDIPLLRGRLITERDRRDTASVVVISRAFAERYYPGGEDPIGRHLALASSNGDTREIVGIVGDVQQSPNMGGYGPLGAPPAAYIPIAQTSDAFVRLAHTWFSPRWVVRTAGRETDVIAGMQEAVTAVEPLLPFSGFQSFDDLRSRALMRQHFQALLFSAVAVLAVLLIAAGIGGLIGHSVAERRRELGLRLALGSSVLRAMRSAALPGILLALTGMALGALLALLAVRTLESFVWGVEPLDATTFVLALGGLLIVAAVASFVPALRILGLDPAETLRAD